MGTFIIQENDKGRWPPHWVKYLHRFHGMQKNILDWCCHNHRNGRNSQRVHTQLGPDWDPFFTWTMKRKGEHHVDIVGVNNKCQITAIFCGNALEVFLLIQLIWKEKQLVVILVLNFLQMRMWHNHVTTGSTRILWLNILVVLLYHITPVFGSVSILIALPLSSWKILKAKLRPVLTKLIISWIPPNTTDRLQPMDSPSTGLPKHI